MKRKTVLKIMSVVFAAVFIVAGYNIVKNLGDNAKAYNLYETLQNEFVTKLEETPTNEEQPQEVKEPAITVDFNALCKKNSEVVGWLYLPNTPINYPVVQAEDNDKYLHLDLNGKQLSAGTMFMDFRNNPQGEDTNYIIYGHHMKNGTMLSAIVKYKSQSFYDEHPVVYYFTPQQKYKVELFAGYLIGYDDEMYDSSLTLDDPTALVAEYKKNSTFKSDVTVTPEDTLLTLSTCTYEYDDARYVVMGKLTELTEEE